MKTPKLLALGSVVGLLIMGAMLQSQGMPIGGAIAGLTSSSTAVTFDRPALFPAGTVGAPGWGWSADADGSGTGGYRSAANTISLACNGAECFRVDANEMRVKNTVRDLGGDLKLAFSTVSGNSWNNQAAATVAGMFMISNSNAVTGAGRVLQVQSGGTTHVTLGPGIQTDFTDSTGSPGAATINKASGKSAINAGADSVVITNSLVAATSRIFVQPTETDATCYGAALSGWIAVAAAGSFTVTATANCTAATNFDWLVIQ